MLNGETRITEKIIGACFKVHNILGPGFNEIIYQRALGIILLQEDIKFAREQWLDIYFLDEPIGKKRIDFIIEEVVVEIKAKGELEAKDFSQLKSYLKALNKPVGLLINFGSVKVQVKRFVLNAT